MPFWPFRRRRDPTEELVEEAEAARDRLAVAAVALLKSSAFLEIRARELAEEAERRFQEDPPRKDDPGDA